MSNRPLPYRWLLPALQLLICLVILWPIRTLLWIELQGSSAFYSPATQTIEQCPSQPNIVIVPPRTTLEEKQLDAEIRSFELRRFLTAALNFPVIFLELPYSIPHKREWHPRGMFLETWRALAWPFVAILFWWMFGRALEALSAARKKQLLPRITLFEGIVGATLCLLGLVLLVGVITTTPDERKDSWFMLLIAGGILWGVFGGLMVTAKFLQRRIRKQITPS